MGKKKTISVMDKRLTIAFNAALAFALAYFFLSSIDVEAVASFLAGARLEWVFAAAALYYALQLITALRLKWLADSMGCNASFSRIFWAHLAGMLFSDYTPGRSGYAYFVVKARDWGLRARQGVRVFGVSLASDFFSRGAFAALSVYYLFGSAESLAFAAAFLLALSAFALWALSAKRRVVSALLPRVPSFGAKMSAFYGAVFRKRMPSRLLAAGVATSFAGAFVRGLEWMCLAAALGHGFAFNELLLFAAFNSVLTALSFVPLSVAGLGLQEGAGALFFSGALGMDLASAGALMVLVRLLEAACNLAGLKELLG